MALTEEEKRAGLEELAKLTRAADALPEHVKRMVEPAVSENIIENALRNHYGVNDGKQ